MLVAAAGALALGAAVPAWGQTTPAPTTTVPPVPTLSTDPALPTVPTTSSAPPPTTTGSTSTGQATTATSTTSTTSTTAAAPAGDSGSGDEGPPAWIVGLIVLGALAVLVLILWGLARMTAWEPRWLPAARHSIGEASYRSSAGWAEFREWLRFRR
jgi:hypothetical protein